MFQVWLHKIKKKIFFVFLGPQLQHMEVQTRGQIIAAAASLRHSLSNTRSQLCCDLHHSSQQHWILSPLNKDTIFKVKDTTMIRLLHFTLFLLFRVTPMAYGGSQAGGLNRSYSCWPTPQPQPHRIRATSVTYTTAHSNAGSLTH